MKRWGKVQNLQRAWRVGRTRIHRGRRLARLSRPQTLGRLSRHDVAIEHGGDLTRVQVKASSARHGTGYFCQIRREHDSRHRPYSLDEVDIFATYLIPVDTWYLIPAAIILTPPVKQAISVYPVSALQRNHYKYEHYREAWGLLGKSRSNLSLRNQRR